MPTKVLVEYSSWLGDRSSEYQQLFELTWCPSGDPRLHDWEAQTSCGEMNRGTRDHERWAAISIPWQTQLACEFYSPANSPRRRIQLAGNWTHREIWLASLTPYSTVQIDSPANSTQTRLAGEIDSPPYSNRRLTQLATLLKPLPNSTHNQTQCAAKHDSPPN